jgi:hypothetical protein
VREEWFLHFLVVGKNQKKRGLGMSLNGRGLAYHAQGLVPPSALEK